MPLSLSHYTETRNHNKRTSLKRLGILVGFVLLLVLLVCNAVILRRELKIQIDNQGRVTHTEQVLTELKKTESLLEVAETGQRGFLYTGDPKYLEHYNLAIEQVEPHLDVLDQLTVGNPNQRARLFALRVLALEKLDELGQTVSLYSSNRADEAKAIVLSDAGLVGMNNIRALTAQMEAEESALKASQTKETQRSIHVTIAGIYLACLVGFLGAILLAFYIFLELNRREQHLHELWKRE